MRTGQGVVLRSDDRIGGTFVTWAELNRWAIVVTHPELLLSHASDITPIALTVNDTYLWQPANSTTSLTVKLVASHFARGRWTHVVAYRGRPWRVDQGEDLLPIEQG